MKNVEINDDSIVLKSKAGTLTLLANDVMVGICLANEHGQLNLVSQSHMAPYICFYKTENGIAKGYPSAMSASEGNDVDIQLGNKDPRKIKNVKLSDLLNPV